MKPIFKITAAINHFYLIRLQLLSRSLLAIIIPIACFTAAAQSASAINPVEQCIGKVDMGWPGIQLTMAFLWLPVFVFLHLKASRIRDIMTYWHCAGFKKKVSKKYLGISGYSRYFVERFRQSFNIKSESLSHLSILSV